MARVGWILVVAMAALVGCRMRDTVGPVRPAAPAVALAPRGSIEPDPTAFTGSSGKTPAPRPEHYRHLTADECRRLAIANAPFAADLDAHPVDGSHIAALFRIHHDHIPAGRLARGYAADEIRNRVAAEALEEYYKLAAAEGQYDQAVAAHSVLAKQLDASQKAVQEGLKDRGDVESIRRQMLTIEGQAARLEAGIIALNASLAARLGLDPAQTAPLWPAGALGDLPGGIDLEEALGTAAVYRPDLNLLRTLLGDEGGNAGLADAVLSGLNPLLGKQPSGHPLVVLAASLKRDSGTTTRQVRSALAARERQADAEVRAAAALAAGHRAAAMAKAAEVRGLTAKIAELEKREAAGQQVTRELTTARLDLLKARGEFVQAIADCHIASVKLRQAMGMLVRE